MHLRLDTYWPLLLLLIIPYLWWVQSKTSTDLSRKHLRLSTAVRSVTVLILAMALMQPVIDRTGSWVSVVYLLDISQSAAPAAVQSAIQWVEKTNNDGHPAHARYIPFASSAEVFASLDQLKKVEVVDKPSEDAIDRTTTNIESALETALHTFEPHYLKRLVLISDGNENAGHSVAMLSRLKTEKVRVYTVPLPTRADRDIWLESIVLPPQVPAGELFPVEVRIFSQIETSAVVQIRFEDKTLGERRVQLARGMNRIGFETSIKDASGPVTVEAEVQAKNDPFPGNNQFRASSIVQGKPKVLYVEGHSESARYLKDALTVEGIIVRTMLPNAIPGTPDELDAYDAVILSDVARSDLTERQMQAIATYVRDLGGGFILVGGENNYGEGGYSNTDIERILPVTFESRKEQPQSVAMMVVLDKSGSMGGDKMELAKEATKAPLKLLRDTDLFGVVAFEYNYYSPVVIQPAANRNEIGQLISSIIAGGETNIFPALREAEEQLVTVTAETKHVILLSDGRTLPEDFEGLVKKMASQKISVSTIAVGVGADRQLLSNIARWGHGRAYYLESPESVPQIFIQETELATGKTLREESFKPIVTKSVEAFKGIDFKEAPALLGYVSTKPKQTSEVLLESGLKDPILARWQYGLGKTVAFTSDLKDRWAVDWLRWKGYPKFWSQLVRQTMRRHDSGGFDFRVSRDGNNAKLTMNAIRKDGRFRNKLAPQVSVVGPDHSVSQISLRQIAPGYYEANLPLPERGSYTFRAAGDDITGMSKVLTYSYPDEFHFYPPNTELLRSISTETRGRFQPGAEDIFQTYGEVTAIPTPLWPYLVSVALALYLADVFLRRLRLFEKPLPAVTGAKR